MQYKAKEFNDSEKKSYSRVIVIIMVSCLMMITVGKSILMKKMLKKIPIPWNLTFSE